MLANNIPLEICQQAFDYAEKLFPNDQDAQEQAACHFLHTDGWEGLSPAETTSRIHSILDRFQVRLIRDRWQKRWHAPVKPLVSLCACGSACEIRDGLCLRCRYQQFIDAKILTKGDERAHQWFVEHDKLVWSMCHRYAGEMSFQDLDDLHSQCWAAIVAANYEERTNAKVSTWLAEISKNVVLKAKRDKLAGHKNQPLTSLNEALATADARFPKSTSVPVYDSKKDKRLSQPAIDTRYEQWLRGKD